MVRLDINFEWHSLGVYAYMWDKIRNKFIKIDALFDTGAHTCAIDTDAFLRLGYSLEDSRKSFISTASSSREEVHRVRIEKIMLDETPLENIIFNTFDFPLISRPIIIGMNLIRQFEISMNFKSKLITMQENYLSEGDDYYDADIFGDWRVHNLD